MVPKSTLRIEQLTLQSGSAALGVDASLGVRCHYWKTEGESTKFVIVDFDTDRRLDFMEQEYGDVRWYPFTPSDEERRLIQHCIQEFAARCSSPSADDPGRYQGDLSGLVRRVGGLP